MVVGRVLLSLLPVVAIVLEGRVLCFIADMRILTNGVVMTVLQVNIIEQKGFRLKDDCVLYYSASELGRLWSLVMKIYDFR